MNSRGTRPAPHQVHFPTPQQVKHRAGVSLRGSLIDLLAPTVLRVSSGLRVQIRARTPYYNVHGTARTVDPCRVAPPQALGSGSVPIHTLILTVLRPGEGYMLARTLWSTLLCSRVFRWISVYCGGIKCRFDLDCVLDSSQRLIFFFPCPVNINDRRFRGLCGAFNPNLSQA